MDSISLLPSNWILRKDYLFASIILICISLAIVLEKWFIIAIPFIILFTWLSVIKTHWVFFILLGTIPFSAEVDLPGGFATDFPDEILMWWLFGLGIIWLVTRTQSLVGLLKNPITWALVIHWLWILFTITTSGDPLISLKYFLSKSWYLMVFFVLAFVFLKNKDRFTWFVIVVTVSACITVLFALVKHSISGFSYSEINNVVRPFYRNHVNYACLLVCIFPYLYPLWKRYNSNYILRTLILTTALIILLGIFFSYTRAAYIALFSVFIIYPVSKWRLINLASIASVMVIVCGFLYYIQENKYLELAPDFNKAVSHTDFSNLLAATPQGKDISTMERLYRWVAGVRMIEKKPFTGFGPSNFYNAYKSYTLTQFTTYVSDNEEHSSTHNYYLMIAVEQGIPGLIFFLCIIYFYYKSVEHELPKVSISYRYWLIASLWSMTSILILLMFNDMIETDKVGSFFFINIAILVRISWTEKERLKTSLI